MILQFIVPWLHVVSPHTVDFADCGSDSFEINPNYCWQCSQA